MGQGPKVTHDANPKPLCVMLVAAEASGDTLGAGLARVLKARLGDGVRFVGIGGEKMAAQGIVSPFEISELSILGILEGVAAYGRVVKRAEDLAKLAPENPEFVPAVERQTYRASNTFSAS